MSARQRSQTTADPVTREQEVRFIDNPPESAQESDASFWNNTPSGLSTRTINGSNGPVPPPVGQQSVAMLLGNEQSSPLIPTESLPGSSTSDEDFFDLDIETYFANGNNSCGFIPGVPVILSDSNDIDYSSSDDYLIPSWTEERHGEQGHNIFDPYNRMKETTVLLRHFVENISPWCV
jgi:hypothetical protein